MVQIFTIELTYLQIIILAVLTLLTLLLSIFKFGRFFGYVETILHEFGHMFTAKLVGQKIAGLKLRYDTSGETITLAKKYGIGGILTHISGYPTPIIIGVVGIMSIIHSTESMNLFLSFLIIVGIIMIFSLKNFFAIIPMFVFIALPFIGITTGQWGATLIVFGLSSIMIVFGIKSLANLWKNNPEMGDAYMLETYTKAPRKFWVSIIILTTFIMSVIFALISPFIFTTAGTIIENFLNIFRQIANIY
jgi:hypothetical protein